MKRILFLFTLLSTATIACHAQDSEWDQYGPADQKYPDANGGLTKGTISDMYTDPAGNIFGLKDGRVVKQSASGMVHCVTLPATVYEMFPDIENGDASIIYCYCTNGCVYWVKKSECTYGAASCPNGGIPAELKKITTTDDGTSYGVTSSGDIYSLENPNASVWEKKASLNEFPSALGASGNIVLVSTASNNGYTNHISTNWGASFNKLSWGNYMEEWIGAIFENPAKAGYFFFGGSAGTLLEYNENGNLSKYNTGTNLGINAGAPLENPNGGPLKVSSSPSAFQKSTLKPATWMEEDEPEITAIFVGDRGLYLFAKSDGTLSVPRQIPDCSAGLIGAEANYEVSIDSIDPTTLKKSVTLVAYAWGETGLWHYNELVHSDFYHLAVSESTIEIPWTENNTITFNITSNDNWAITSSQGWLTTEPDSGSGDATITLIVGSNPASDTRTDTLTVTGDQGLVQTVVVTQSINTGIAVLKESGWTFFPNPVNDKIKFTIPTNEIAITVNIFNENGQLIEQISNPENNEINFSDKRSGLYFIRLVTQTNHYLMKIIKQ